MASHPPVAPPAIKPALGPESPIENELPTYRAISPMAVTSLVLGLISALNFASWSFGWLAVAVLAVITGALALRNIARMPDALTGRSFAQAGIAMGLVFGVTSQALNYYQLWSLNAEARAFGQRFAATLQEVQKTNPPETSDAVWYMIPSEMRRGLTPEDAKAQLAQVLEGSEKVRNIDDTIRAMVAHAGNRPIRFQAVEDARFQDLNSFASLLMEVTPGDAVAPTPEGESSSDDHDGHNHPVPKVAATVHSHVGEPEGMDHALVVVKGMGPSRSANRWHVEAIKYPYRPNSYVPPAPRPPDDGHGHDH